MLAAPRHRRLEGFLFFRERFAPHELIGGAALILGGTACGVSQSATGQAPNRNDPRRPPATAQFAYPRLIAGNASCLL